MNFVHAIANEGIEFNEVAAFEYLGPPTNKGNEQVIRGFP